MVNKRQKSSCAWCSQKLPWWKTPCEIIQLQSRRCSHQGNGGAERMVQIIGSQIKAYRIQIEKSTDITTQAERPTFNRATTTCRLEVHAVSWTTGLTIHIVQEDSTHALWKPCPVRWRGSYVQTTRSMGSTSWDQHGSTVFGPDATTKPTSIKTDEHLIEDAHWNAVCHVVVGAPLSWATWLGPMANDAERVSSMQAQETWSNETKMLTV